jgi:hypothetical protein
MFKPIMPLVSDAWSHTFAEAMHIATVHAKYGANHLEQQLASSQKDNPDNSKNQNTVKAAEPVPKYYAVFKLPMLQAVFISTLAPPPKFSC